MKIKPLIFSFFLLGLILIAITIVSCKKDKENILPVITVLSPLENSTFAIPDLIPIHAEIEDDKLIQSISVVIVDEELKPVTNAKNYFPKSKSHTLIDDFDIPGINLNTGNYYLKIKANDAQDFKNKYVQIFIEGSPRILDQIIVLTQPGNNNIKISGIADFGNISELFTIEGDYSASAVSSKHQRIFISGIEKINLRAYDLYTTQLSWEKGIIPHWPMHNSKCMHYDDMLYVTFNYRDIFGYDFDGLEKYNSKVDEMDSPGRVYKHTNFILSDIQKKNGSIPYVSAFHAASGVEAQRINTSFKVVDFISRNDDLVTIIANSSGYGTIWEYNVTNNEIRNLFNSDKLFLSSVGRNSNTIYISTPDCIAEYSVNTNTFVPVLYQPNVKHMAYEELSDLLLAANNTELLLINLPEMTNQKTIEFSDLILNIHLLYSK